MAACPHCGAANDKGSRYCSSCGAALAIPAMPVSEARKTVTALFYRSQDHSLEVIATLEPAEAIPRGQTPRQKSRRFVPKASQTGPARDLRRSSGQMA